MHKGQRTPNQKTCVVTPTEDSQSSISRALNRDVTSGEEMPGWRNRRAVSQNGSEVIPGPGFVEKSWRTENKFGCHERKFEFLQIQIRIRLFFGTFAFVDLLAKLARMFPVERFFECFGQRPIVRIIDYHLCPGKRLENRPMQAD